MTQQDLLDRLENDLRAVLEQVRAQLAPQDEHTLRRRPSPEKWNILECLAHLNKYADDYFPRIELAIHKAKARQWTPAETHRYNAFGRQAVQRVQPDNTRAYKAAKRYNFANANLPVSTVKAFIINAEMLLRLIHLSREVDLNKAKVKQIRFPYFQYRLGNLLEFLVQHARRHVRQAERLI